MHRPFLGKNHLHWCDACHVPVLARRCSCGGATREVPLTPPGDVRPAFPSDVETINRIYADCFGAPLIPEGHLALLNKVPDADRMEEVIVGGAVVGAVRYLPKIGRWEAIPRVSALALMQPTRRVVTVDDGAVASIREGASLLAPGLVAIDDAVAAGDEVFLIGRSGEAAGVGRARFPAAEAREMKRGAIVRTRKNTSTPCIPGAAGWERAVEANAAVLAGYELKAIEFVRETAEQHPLPPSVSYSGGKDSLAVLLVVCKAIGKVPLIFADSGLEFPETLANVEEVAARYGLPLEVARHGGKFWEFFEREGPPAIDARWCCAVCKLTPVNELIGERFGECLSFIGQRRYESVRRAASRRIWRNPKIPRQLAAAPLQHWTALHVWLYLFSQDAPYNRLYAEGLDRIGCFMCPASDMAVIERIRELHPDLWSSWEERLEAYRASRGLPPEWSREGLWRQRRGSSHG
ncbi:MAG: phosphoadenosine phosphosulfate reductase family protein [Methanomicrobiales archaeon]|nr:phosphoadenosine phosphosulfate reductase family protein [Methanomicrobiales archaeon]MDI6877192.1 phosphoadenosine phosphosulfate reductase family protein [Methanomicrobiales archaeon]